MADTQPLASIAQGEKSAEFKQRLEDLLDDLLGRYLLLLDQYQSLRKELSTNLASVSIFA